jgi:hypothetical protein
MAIKYTKWPQNIPNGRKICRLNGHAVFQHLPLHEPPKFTQTVIFGLKINHLATLTQSIYYFTMLRLLSLFNQRNHFTAPGNL